MFNNLSEPVRSPFHGDKIAQVAYEEVRMLRELFSNGTLIFHDTLHHGVPVAEFRPFLHAYATATLMSEGVHSSNGTSWQWPRYAVAQFRRSNAFGDGVYSDWTGKGGVWHSRKLGRPA